MSMTLEELILSLGLQFRNLTHHSDGGWSCRLMHDFKGTDEFWGNTPHEAVAAAKQWLDKFDD